MTDMNNTILPKYQFGTPKVKKFIAGLIQFDVRLGNTDENLKTVLSGIRYLGEQGVQLTILPEMWSCGFDNKNLAEHAKKSPEILDILAQQAMKYKMIIAGSVPEYSENGIFNTMYVIDIEGSIAGSYRKIHLFSYSGEHKHYIPGDKSVVCNTSLIPIGLLICYDLRFPEICRALALKGALAVIVSAQWPKMRVRHWDILNQARAIENQLFMISTNRCGIENELVFGGHSQIVDPYGNLMTVVDTEPCNLFGEIDLEKIQTYRNRIPCLKERMPHTYGI